MNNKVNFLRGTSTEYATSAKDNDTFYYTTDDEKLYLGNKEITGIEIDDTTSTATGKTWSAKHITSALANKADSSDIPTKISELTNDSGYITSPDGGNAKSLNGYTIEVTDVDPGAGSALNTGEIVFVTEVT